MTLVQVAVYALLKGVAPDRKNVVLVPVLVLPQIWQNVIQYLVPDQVALLILQQNVIQHLVPDNVYLFQLTNQCGAQE